MILVKDIIDYLNDRNMNFKYVGDENIEVCGFSSLNNYKVNTITWIKAEKNILTSIKYEDIALIVKQNDIGLEFPSMISTNESKKVFFSIIEHFFAEKVELPSVGKGTFISSQVKLGKNVKIGHNCILDGDISIGDGTVIYHNVSIINRVIIGQNCVIQSGVSIGQDGFAYVNDSENCKTMVKHHGGVLIEDEVFIGVNTNIARGTIDDTIICKGSKIDALCHIAHNVHIGARSALIAGSLVYGSAKLGKNSYIASGIIRNQKSIGSNAIVGMGSVVTKDVPEGKTVVGVPGKPLR